jgi:hypothetical protein
MKVKCGDDYVYTIVEVEDGWVQSIYDEAGREGGYIYKRGEFGDDLQEKLNHLAYDYGNYKYDCVLFSAEKENLTSYNVAYAVIQDRVWDRIQESIKLHEDSINTLRLEGARLMDRKENKR